MKNENPEFLRLNLRRLIDGRGWSYKRFALESGVSYHTVFRAITHGRVPRGGNLQKMAKALGVSISNLWEEPSIKPPRDYVTLGDLARGDARIFEILDKRLPQEGEDFQKLKDENMRLQAENKELIKSNEFLQDLKALVPRLEEQIKSLTTIINDERNNKKRLYRTAKTDQDLKNEAKRPHSRKAK